MKTVQEWLGGLDRNRLLDLYASRYPLHAEDTSGNRSYPERAGGAAGSADPGHR